jgi:hypothetical protein
LNIASYIAEITVNEAAPREAAAPRDRANPEKQVPGANRSTNLFSQMR